MTEQLSYHYDSSRVANATSLTSHHGKDNPLFLQLKESQRLTGALCVFCGSSSGDKPEYTKAAQQLGRSIAEAGWDFCYGGALYGLMGASATAVLTHPKGRVHGVIPRAMISVERKALMDKVPGIPQELKDPVRVDENRNPIAGTDPIRARNPRSVVTVTNGMHERKRIMGDLSSLGFIALPGGFGTLEELAEMTTWTQLGIHKKPVILLNVNGFYNGLRMWLDVAVNDGFIRKENKAFMIFVDAPQGVDHGLFDWGKAAIDSVAKWHGVDGGLGGGVPYSGMTWGTCDEDNSTSVEGDL